MRKNITRLIRIYFSCLFLICASAFSAENLICTSPAKEIKVTVRKDVSKYLYKAHNLGKAPVILTGFSLGDSNHEEMYAINENIPESLKSPAGWDGGTDFTFESVYMRIYWKAKEPFKVESGKSLGYFEVNMPKSSFEKGKKIYLYGEFIEAMNMQDVPFNILFADGRCVWGRVEKER